MKRHLLYLFLISILLASCGSTERVITDDGSTYTVKGNDIYKNGEDITETLSENEKQSIKETLKTRLEAEAIARKKQDKLEKQEQELKRERDKIEKERKRLERETERKEEARRDYLKAKDDLAKQKKRYSKLLEKGKLSPNDIEDWDKKIKELEKRVEERERDFRKA